MKIKYFYGKENHYCFQNVRKLYPKTFKHSVLNKKNESNWYNVALTAIEMCSRPHKYKLHIGVYIIILSNKTSFSHNCLNLMELPRAKLSSVCATFLQDALPFCDSITRQPIKLESFSNPLQIQKVLWFPSKTKFFRFVFSVGCVIMGAWFRGFVAEVTWTWAPIQKAIFLVQGFFGVYDIIRVLRALDWLASISGAKLMAQKTKIV